MKKLISEKLAGIMLIVLNSLFALFHILVILKIIPADMVWGGQIKDSPSNILMMELIALIVTAVFILFIALKISKFRKYRRAINIVVWIIFIYFVLNIFGNLASEHFIEKVVFAFMAFMMSFLALRLAIEK